MFVPRFYPEPENMLLRAGWFRPGEAPIFRELDASLTALAGRCFGREFPYPAGDEAYLLRVDEDGVEAAAASPAGFLHAARALEALRHTDRTGAMGVKTGMLFDRPAAPLRAVDLSRVQKGSAEFLRRFISLMAGLKYNALVADWDGLGIPEEDRGELESLCGQNCITIFHDAGGPTGIVAGLHGPSFLDWEHVSRRPGFTGATVEYGGELSVEAMARSGFLHNLVYSSAMMWKEGYCNFTWESLAEPAMERAREAYRLLAGEPPELDRDLSDVYPAYLCSEGGGRPAVIQPGQRAAVAFLGGRARALVFTHALENSGPEAACAGVRPVGRYIVRYADGTETEIPLVENETIGGDGVWCGRRYNARTHRFDTDARLHSLCCRTGIVKTVRADGSLALAYELAWSNPRPQVEVDRVELEVSAGAGKAIRVHGIDIAE